jgi:pyridoxamine 5'-phosphate oxidase
MSATKIDWAQPFEKFSTWFDDAQAKKEIVEPTAMCLSTVDNQGNPSSRMVLLKTFDQRGFCFFTNLTSRKGKELEQNQNVALCFYWGILGRQVRIEGKDEKVSVKEADDYFSSRRRGSQIGAWASKQSCEMKDWSEFEERLDEITKDFEGREVPRPPFWSGFRVIPKRIEFWQEGDFRIHRREVYEKFLDGWKIKKIYP